MEATIGLTVPRRGRHGGHQQARSRITVAELLDRRSELDGVRETRAAQPVPLTPAIASARRGKHSPLHETAPDETGAGKPRLLLASAGAAVLVVAIGATMAVAQPSHAATVTTQPRLALTTAAVHLGGSYLATASGFTPGEHVRFSWTGPTHGAMGSFDADSTGRARVPGPIVEKDPPGSYQIIATGLASGHVVATPLQVLAATTTGRPGK